MNKNSESRKPVKSVSVTATEKITILARQLAWDYMHGVPYGQVLQELALAVKVEANGHL
jgi:hypothetical protein